MRTHIAAAAANHRRSRPPVRINRAPQEPPSPQQRGQSPSTTTPFKYRKKSAKKSSAIFSTIFASRIPPSSQFNSLASAVRAEQVPKIKLDFDVNLFVFLAPQTWCQKLGRRCFPLLPDMPPTWLTWSPTNCFAAMSSDGGGSRKKS